MPGMKRAALPAWARRSLQHTPVQALAWHRCLRPWPPLGHHLHPALRRGRPPPCRHQVCAPKHRAPRPGQIRCRACRGHLQHHHRWRPPRPGRRQRYRLPSASPHLPAPPCMPHPSHRPHRPSRPRARTYHARSRQSHACRFPARPPAHRPSPRYRPFHHRLTPRQRIGQRFE